MGVTADMILINILNIYKNLLLLLIIFGRYYYYSLEVFRISVTLKDFVEKVPPHVPNHLLVLSVVAMSGVKKESTTVNKKWMHQ